MLYSLFQNLIPAALPFCCACGAATVAVPLLGHCDGYVAVYVVYLCHSCGCCSNGLLQWLVVELGCDRWTDLIGLVLHWDGSDIMRVLHC